MARTIHLAQSVRGALMNWEDHLWVNCCRDDSGRVMTPREVKAEFLDLLSKGVELIPFGGPCEGFDPVTGCPGHEIPDPSPAPERSTP